MRLQEKRDAENHQASAATEFLGPPSDMSDVERVKLQNFTLPPGIPSCFRGVRLKRRRSGPRNFAAEFYIPRNVRFNHAFLRRSSSMRLLKKLGVDRREVTVG